MAGEFERRGFRVVSPLDADPTLAAPTGFITRKQAGSFSHGDLVLALEAAKEHGRTDEGQAVVVRGGEVIAREDRAGTDAMLAAVAQTGDRGGILAKAMKPDQIRNIDPPAIGESTVTVPRPRGLMGW